MRFLKVVISLIAVALLVGCLNPPQTWSTPSGTSVYLSPQARRVFDSIAAKSLRENAEQLACVERWRIDEDDRWRTINITRVGSSPLAWTSDSVQIWAPATYTHLCYLGQPTVHTHPAPYGMPSETDFHTTFEREMAPFDVVLMVKPNGEWQAMLYAVRP